MIDAPIIMATLTFICLFVWNMSQIREIMNSRAKVQRSTYKKRKTSSHTNIVVFAILLVLHACALAYCIVLGTVFENKNITVLALLFLLGVSVWSWIIRFVILNRKKLNKGILMIWLLYLAVLLFVTVFSRMDTVESTIRMEPFYNLKKALELGNSGLISHSILNVIMFTPLGFVLSWLEYKEFSKCWRMFLIGVSVSIVIESVQLVFRWGECDINDIIANSMGAVLGLLIMKLFRKTQIIKTSRT